jgi:hypothetical protein|tara:strand:+ start:715 stop:1569 length:855 start_codon:yes stop_codon:yes gene_type:complete
MNHPAELAINQYLEDATSGKSTISEETIAQIGKDVMDAVRRQFGGGKGRDEFRLRMSNIGKPTCQLWFAKNKPEKALPKPTTFVMNMLLGDIVEAAFKGIITEAGVAYDDKDNFVELELKEDTIKGSYDLIMDGALDDVKSASDWSYRNKFESYETLSKSDPFGYVGQLAGYAKATGKKVGGWWVVNKANGNIKYVPASGLDLDVELDKIQKTVDTVNKNEFERCFHPVPETFRGKPSGHKILNDNCKFCDFRFECYPQMQELPSKVSQARVKPIVSYIEINEG